MRSIFTKSIHSTALTLALVASAPAGNAAETAPRRERTIEFSGRTWRVKDSAARKVGPGPCYFSADCVSVDASGRLHLRLLKRGGRWLCGEIISTENLAYGTYSWHLDTPSDRIAENIVLGLFTWDDKDPAFYHREIDIELSRWGQANNDNYQFVVQPFQQADRIRRFMIAPTTGRSVHVFRWEPEAVVFKYEPERSAIDAPASPAARTWTYAGPGVPPEGETTNARINLWIVDGSAPVDPDLTEVIISRFEFTPFPKS